LTFSFIQASIFIVPWANRKHGIRIVGNSSDKKRTALKFDGSVGTVAGIAFILLCGCNNAGNPPNTGDAFVQDEQLSRDVLQDTEAPDSFHHRVFVHVQDEPLHDIATGDFNKPAIEYPPIPVDPKYSNLLTFQMAPMMPPIRKSVPTNGPIIMYSKDLDTFVFSPLDNFFVSVVWVEGGKLHYGLEGEINEVPAGFTHRFLMVEGKGINATIQAWGEILRQEYKRERTDRYADIGLSYIGYWTDNGTRYYYMTEGNLNEQDTLLEVQRAAKAMGVHFGYFQLDSWWYIKESGTGLLAGGLVEWVPQPQMFPDGLRAFHEALGLPLILHNRWFARENAYNNEYPFVTSERMSFPTTGDVFDRFMEDAKSWGAITYEQDWLVTQFLSVPWLRETVYRADEWMSWIDEGASKYGLTVQICMPGPGHLLDALRHPNFTTVRTSVDHMTDRAKEAFWPPFHIVNMIASALGILPFKDNFITTEFASEQEALISTLSAGMVGIGDAVGKIDPVVVGRTCRKDGLILKPDLPATPLDAMFLEHKRPFTVATSSYREGLGTWVYLLAFNLALEHKERLQEDRFWSAMLYEGMPLEEMWFLPDEVSDWHVDIQHELQVSPPVVAYDWRTKEALLLTSKDMELPRIEHFADYDYIVLVPIASNGLALIGEIEKFVTMADRRFRNIEVLKNGFQVTLEGSAGEVVSIQLFDTVHQRLLGPYEILIGEQGTAMANLVVPE
jgi:hypothetical protein